MQENKLKVLHTADLHLGSAFSNLPPEIAAELRKEQKDMLFRLIGICREEGAGLLLLAGDVFDRPFPDKELVRLFLDSMKEIPGTDVFITPGNHDPFFADSPWGTEAWPANVHLFGPDRKSFVLDEKKVQVDGSAFSGFTAETPLFEGVERTVPEEYFRFLMWHGDLTDQASSYNPLSAGAAFLKDYDYVALGHIHKELTEKIRGTGNVLIRYPGCPGGRGFDELGESFFWLGHFTKGQGGTTGTWDRIPAGTRSFLWFDADIAGCTDAEQVKERLLKVIAGEVSALTDTSMGKKALMRIVLKGRVPEEMILDTDYYANYLKSEGFCYTQIIDDTRVLRDLERLKDQPGFTGLLIQNYLSRLAKAGNEDEKRELETALEYVFQAAQGEL